MYNESIKNLPLYLEDYKLFTSDTLQTFNSTEEFYIRFMFTADDSKDRYLLCYADSIQQLSLRVANKGSKMVFQGVKIVSLFDDYGPIGNRTSIEIDWPQQEFPAILKKYLDWVKNILKNELKEPRERFF